MTGNEDKETNVLNAVMESKTPDNSDSAENVSRETLADNKRKKSEKQEKPERAEHKQARLAREAEKRREKELELERIRRKAGLDAAAAKAKEEERQQDDIEVTIAPSPTVSQMYARFRANKLSRIESGYNALYLYCNDKYYSSTVGIKEKYKNIYAHPTAWFHNQSDMWKRNKWWAAVRLLEIIPMLQRVQHKLLHLRTRFHGKLKNLWRHMEYSHIAARSFGRLLKKSFAYVLLAAFTVFCAVSILGKISFVPALALYIDGSYVGDAPSISDVEKTAATYEDSMSASLGTAYRLETNITYQPAVIRHGEEIQQSKLNAALDEASARDMMQGYGLYVDDTLVCCAPYKAWFDSAMNESLEIRKQRLDEDGEEVQNIAFFNNFSVVAGSFPNYMFRDLGDIREMFSLDIVAPETKELLDKTEKTASERTIHELEAPVISAAPAMVNIATTELPVSELDVQNNTVSVVTDVSGEAAASSDAAQVKTVEVMVEKTVTEAIPIPFGTEYRDDPNLVEGRTRVLIPGIDGERDVTYRVSYVGNKQVGKEELYEVIKSEPTTQIISVGTRTLTEEEKRVASKGTYIWPYKGKVTSDYAWRVMGSRNEFHKGLDIGGPRNSAIVASDGGVVTFAAYDNSGYGNCVLIRHDDGTVTRYAHCSELYVTVGQKVAQGETIAAMGMTGSATGVHVHFEVIIGGKTQDPKNYLQ